MEKVFSRLQVLAMNDDEWKKMSTEERLQYLDLHPFSKYAQEDQYRNMIPQKYQKYLPQKKEKKPVKQEKYVNFNGQGSDEIDSITDFKKYGYTLDTNGNALTFISKDGEEPVVIEQLPNKVVLWIGKGSQSKKEFKELDNAAWSYIKAILPKFK